MTYEPWKQVEVIQVVRTRLNHRGKGTEGDPHRIVTQFWSLDGDLLAEVDNWANQQARQKVAVSGVGS